MSVTYGPRVTVLQPVSCGLLCQSGQLPGHKYTFNMFTYLFFYLFIAAFIPLCILNPTQISGETQILPLLLNFQVTYGTLVSLLRVLIVCMIF